MFSSKCSKSGVIGALPTQCCTETNIDGSKTIQQLTSNQRSRSTASLQMHHSHRNSHHHHPHAPSQSSSEVHIQHYAAVPVPPTSRIDPNELEQVAAFYRSHRTMVFVGQCLVGLYFTETELIDGGRTSRPRCENWKLTVTGIPVLILNRGDVKSRDKRQIQIFVAERGSGLPLWSDIIDGLSGYKANEKNFHTMYLSDDHRKMAGLSFDCPVAAQEFYHKIEPILDNPENISLTRPKQKSKSSFLFRKNRSKSVGRNVSQDFEKRSTLERFWNESSDYGKNKNFRVPSKCDISQPCFFQHVASVNEYNCDEFSSTVMMLGALPNSTNRVASSSDRASDLQSTSDGNSVHYSSPEPLPSGDRSPIGSFSDVRNVVVIHHNPPPPDSSLSSSSNFSY